MGIQRSLNAHLLLLFFFVVILFDPTSCIFLSFAVMWRICAPLFISCCSAWEGDFECEIDSTITSFTNITTSANITNINLSPTPALAVNVSTVHNKSPTETNTEALTSNEPSSMPLETVSEFATVIEELEGTVNQTTSQNAKEDDNPLVYILIPFLFAVLVILGVYCIRTKIQRTKSKYAIMFRSFAKRNQ